MRAFDFSLSLTIHLNEFRFIGNLVEEENLEPRHSPKSHKKNALLIPRRVIVLMVRESSMILFFLLVSAGFLVSVGIKLDA